MRAYNKRLHHVTTVKSIDFKNHSVQLLLPESSPNFYYDESLNNVELQENTGVMLDGINIYVGDLLEDSKGNRMKVEKVPGGYFPFMIPAKENFKRLSDGM